jgi:thiol-disulfide isomerase/thioredoxin
MDRIIIIGLVILSLFSSCNSGKQGDPEVVLPFGEWRGVLKPQDIEIPFIMKVEQSGEDYRINLINAEESIPLDDITITGDSIHIPMYIFDATIHARITENKMEGVYVKDYLDDYQIPFEAEYGSAARFAGGQPSDVKPFVGKWEVDFINEDGIDKAIGVFQEYDDGMKGTFATPTGDYRFLEGAVAEGKMKLSCFDGTNAYLFEASLNSEGGLEGNFWSGKTWHQSWSAIKNENFELPDPYALTFMKKGYEQFEIKFPNTSGDLVELADEQYENKVVVIQILGTWCPNCMDETKFYVDWLKKHPDNGVEFIGLAFERKPEADYAYARIEKMKEKLGVPYEVLLAGTTSPESRTKALPMLNKIMSFPTSIILDRQHKVRKIHTGFSGPGTGEYYEKFVEDFNLLMDKLTAE